jgi:hypothetical protein
MTALRVASETREPELLLLSTTEAVQMETPTALATSFSVARLRSFGRLFSLIGTLHPYLPSFGPKSGNPVLDDSIY